MSPHWRGPHEIKKEFGYTDLQERFQLLLKNHIKPRVQSALYVKPFKRDISKKGQITNYLLLQTQHTRQPKSQTRLSREGGRGFL